MENRIENLFLNCRTRMSIEIGISDWEVFGHHLVAVLLLPSFHSVVGWSGIQLRGDCLSRSCIMAYWRSFENPVHLCVTSESSERAPRGDKRETSMILPVVGLGAVADTGLFFRGQKSLVVFSRSEEKTGDVRKCYFPEGIFYAVPSGRLLLQE
jgi:hypothetical protein